jgi:hypothetical protein
VTHPEPARPDSTFTMHGPRSRVREDGGMLQLRGRQVSLGLVVWIVAGMIVAGDHQFLRRLDSLSRVLSAILAVAVWPLVVLRVHFGI